LSYRSMGLLPETLKARPVVSDELAAKAQRDVTPGVDRGIQRQARATLALQRAQKFLCDSFRFWPAIVTNR